jgi:hypothetical protein
MVLTWSRTVWAERLSSGDLFGGEAAGEQEDDLDLAIRQAVGLEQDRVEVPGAGRFDRHRDGAVVALHGGRR